MANAIYVSPVLNTNAEEDAGLRVASVLFAHLAERTGGYNVPRFIKMDFNLTTPNRVTLILTAQLPPGQVARYSLTLV